MKKIYLALMLPFLAVAQTPEQRQKIVSTYNQELVKQAIERSAQFIAEQKARVAAYKATHDVKEDERRSLQRIDDDGTPIFFTIFNDGSSKTIRANSMYPGNVLGLNVTGAEMTAGVWDGGKVRNTHQEFNGGKVMINDAAQDMSAHATHVTGTVIASGVSPLRRGIAYNASAICYDWDSDVSEMNIFGSLGYLVSNHSYGYQTESLPMVRFGQYDFSSVEIDEVSNAFPYYQMVIAAGNDRNSGIEQDMNEAGYDLISGMGVAKNGITVAAIEEMLVYNDPSSAIMSSFSNFGPVDDGRVKPDVAAKGVGVSSPTSTSNTSYGEFSGTSMASPAVAGLVLLLQQHYMNVTGEFMRASTVRGLICHSAREAGFWDGPDYEFGWGVADGRTAAEIISARGTSSVIEEHTLNNGGVFTKNITVTEPSKVQVTICWTDPVGLANGSGANDSRVPRLRNDLDLVVTKGEEVNYPYSLNPNDPFSPATNFGDNKVDNVERVDMLFATPGTYTIEVRHKGATLVGGNQVFSLIASGDAGISLSTNDNNFRNDIIVYPNPVRNTINFSLPNNEQVSTVAIYDILGKEVKLTSQPVSNSLDVSHLTSGVYFVKFTANGNVATRKFIKE